MNALAYMLAFARNLILYGRLTVWVALPRDGFWYDDAQRWVARGFIPFNRMWGGLAEIRPARTIWDWRRT